MRVIDSHTGGEPTRVILEGGPDLGSGPLPERAARLARDHMDFCRALVGEPRGQVAMVGALLVKPTTPDAACGVIYFDSEAVLGMCGHGTIGLAVTLAYMEKIGIGHHKIETPVGLIKVELQDSNTVAVNNVASFRAKNDVLLEINGYGEIRGDIAFGGNWFFIIDPSPIAVNRTNISELTQLGIHIRNALKASPIAAGISGEIDHVVFQDKSSDPMVHSRNFVLCPDNAYDRSPCGTGSSARLACLAADGQLAPEEEILQESVIGSRYRLSYTLNEKAELLPKIIGQAWVMAESKLIFPEGDPFSAGIK